MSSQGSNANLNGKKFEEIVVNNFFKDLEDNGYQVDEESIRSNNGKMEKVTEIRPILLTTNCLLFLSIA